MFPKLCKEIRIKLLHSNLYIYNLIMPMPVIIQFDINVNVTEIKDRCFYFIDLNIKKFIISITNYLK